jgi:O-antigen/teichoic acid export membrane protein
MVILLFFIFSEQVGRLFHESREIKEYLPLLGIFIAFWVFSNNLETVLIIEKKAFWAGLFVLISEGARALLTIIAVVVFSGGLKEILYVQSGVAAARTIVMFIYFIVNRQMSYDPLRLRLVFSQLTYAVPLGFAVIVRTFTEYSHNFIVSIEYSASVFAVYSVGCFQFPFVSILTDSIARVVLVRIGELNFERKLGDIASIISMSIRKLWIVFFPIFVIFWLTAEEFIVALFTADYTESVPIFRIFILVLPLSALLVEHLPRGFDRTPYLLKINFITFVVTVLFVLLFLDQWGLGGAAVGFLLGRALRKLFILEMIKVHLSVRYKDLIPISDILHISFISIVCGALARSIIYTVHYPPHILLALQLFIFFPLCIALFWFMGVISRYEKEQIKEFKNKCFLSVRQVIFQCK